MINWLFICLAIIKYAQHNSKALITSDRAVSLKEVLDIFQVLYPLDAKAKFLSEYLYQYFKQRQSKCKKDLEREDYISEWDIRDDKKYEFEYEGVKGLI